MRALASPEIQPSVSGKTVLVPMDSGATHHTRRPRMGDEDYKKVNVSLAAGQQTGAEISPTGEVIVEAPPICSAGRIIEFGGFTSVWNPGMERQWDP